MTVEELIKELRYYDSRGHGDKKVWIVHNGEYLSIEETDQLDCESAIELSTEEI